MQRGERKWRGGGGGGGGVVGGGEGKRRSKGLTAVM